MLNIYNETDVNERTYILYRNHVFDMPLRAFGLLGSRQTASFYSVVLPLSKPILGPLQHAAARRLKKLYSSSVSLLKTRIFSLVRQSKSDDTTTTALRS